MQQLSEKDLDCTNCARGLWLVKVPKYLSEKWNASAPSAELGRIRVSKLPGKPQSVTFVSSGQTTTNNEEKLPQEHRLICRHVKMQSLGVFSQANADSTEAERLFMEGQIIQKYECQPVADDNYYNLKRTAIAKAAQPECRAKILERVVQTYKPVANHKHIIDLQQKKKEEGKKSRDDKETVNRVLFDAFEKHQYYNIKDLQKITRQPITYLKEILKEICDYNVKNPHKNMWELKPEYRCYKQPDAKEDAAMEVE